VNGPGPLSQHPQHLRERNQYRQDLLQEGEPSSETRYCRFGVWLVWGMDARAARRTHPNYCRR